MKSTFALLLALLGSAPIAFAQLPPLPQPAKPDKAGELMKSAYLKYQKKDLNGASADLDEAKKIIDSKRQEQAGKLFPEVEGWTSTQLRQEEVPLVGGTRLHRTYSTKGKDVVAEVIMDSPLVEKLGALFANPEIAQASGQSVRRMDGFDALIKDDNNKIELTVWLGSGMLFKLSSDKARENEIVSLAKKFDLREIAKLKRGPAEAK